MERLFEVLQWKRSYASESEQDFIKQYIATIPNIKHDIEGNYWLRIGESRTMFSCHTDTVHHKSGMQDIMLMKDYSLIVKSTVKSDPQYDGECLGADDGAGIWIMLEMIDAEVPGLYIFHRGEEMGGIGSDFIVDKYPLLVENIDRAIAFDRRGKHDIITHQAGQRCCSDEFAWALGELFANHNPELMMFPCSGGVFTDTASYVGLIPECTNLSVGYDNEHTVNEELDLTHVQELRNACVSIDWESLPTIREAIDEYDAYTNRSGSAGYGWPTYKHQEAEPLRYSDALEICQSSPEVIADLLVEWEVTYADVERVYEDIYGNEHYSRYAK